MSKRKSTMTHVLKTAIKRSGKSRYEIAQATGVLQTSISRFMRGETSLRLDKADALAEYLELRLLPDPEAVLPEPTSENLARPTLAKTKRKPN